VPLFELFLNKQTGDSCGPGRRGARGHRVGDPCTKHQKPCTNNHCLHMALRATKNVQLAAFPPLWKCNIGKCAGRNFKYTD